MASCCVSREVWIHSLLAVPPVLHAVRASRSWRPRVARVARVLEFWRHAPMGNACERACESAPLQPLQPAPLHRSLRASRCKSTDYETTRRRGDVARTHATMGHRHAPPPESRNGLLLMAMWKDGVQASRGGSAACVPAWPASVWRAGGLASRHRVPVFREDGVRPKIGNHLHSSIWR